MLAGNPTPGYAAQLIVNHIEDYGFIRYEMGYAAAVSVGSVADRTGVFQDFHETVWRGLGGVKDGL